MKTVRFGKTELMVSEIAFGGIPIQRLTAEQAVQLIHSSIDLGINFFDTANSYTDSEEKIGLAIKNIPRDSLVIATKSGALDKKTFIEHLDLSLKRLGTDYIDIYQHHSMSTIKSYDAIFSEGGANEGMVEAVKSGKVRFPAFSSHNIPLAMQIMREQNYFAVQLPFNYLDDEAAKAAIPLARELDMGFIAMKPFGGGLLSNADLCIRYLAQFDGIIPDPGIEKVEEIREIIRLTDGSDPLTDEDLQTIERQRKELGDHWCHRCDYCQPCPEEIAISMVLNLQSFIKRTPFNRTREMLGASIQRARDCQQCMACTERCPYNLDIPQLLKERLSQWDEFIVGQQ